MSSLGRVLNLKEISEVRFMCPLYKLDELDGLVPRGQRLIAFLGGGEYHHFSLLFLRRISLPFVLLLFDKHFDGLISKENSFVRCDSWLRFALELDTLYKVLFICRADVERGKLRFLPPDPFKLLRAIKGKRVYISIDKDILDIPLTRWGKGWLSLSELLSLLKVIPQNKIIGVDICGEPDELELWKIPQSESINLALLKALGVKVPEGLDNLSVA